MRNQVPAQIAQQRSRVLRELAAKKRQAFMQSFVGQTIEAITLRSNNAKDMTGPHPGRFSLGGDARPTFTECLTDNYLKLHLKGSHEPNRWLQARVERVENGTLVGSPR